MNVKDAFTKDATSLKRLDDRLYSWLDDNGDHKGHPPHNLEDDGEIAEVTQIGIPNSESLALEDWGFARLFSHGELRVYDSQGRVTGLVSGEVKEEIPNSIYDEENEIVAIFSPTDAYHYEIVGTDEGTYGLSIASVENGTSQTFARMDVPTSTNATHQYTINWSTHEATVRIDSDGDGTFEQNLTLQPPVASFTHAPENPVVNQAITFNASPSYDPDGYITNYEWNFGDGTNGTGEVTTHSYSSPGEYPITLTVTDNSSVINSTTRIITIPDTIPPASITNLTNITGERWINWTWTNPPDADFNYTMVYLNGIWQINTSNEYYNATGLIPNTNYTISTHTVDEVGNINETWVNQTAKTQAENQPPIASFTYTPQNPFVNETITFNASSSYDPDGFIVNYTWNFGDGGNTTNTTEPIITHSYNSAGNYAVNLTVTDNDGMRNSTTKTITISEKIIFDTGAPENPYPSISGTHNGTITPSCNNITVSKLYTYPCPGTGGHTEYARIWNSTWNATATWKGYAGDWHNITFGKPVVLMANEEYHYTIRTGSYPQIHHTPALSTSNGWMNCTEFTDANGKVYYDWIPAIRLE